MGPGLAGPCDKTHKLPANMPRNYLAVVSDRWLPLATGEANGSAGPECPARRTGFMSATDFVFVSKQYMRNVVGQEATKPE